MPGIALPGTHVIGQASLRRSLRNLVKNRVVLLLVIAFLIFLTISTTRSGDSPDISPQSNVLQFPLIPPEHHHSTQLPTLSTRPHSLDIPFTRYPHSLPYSGAAYHLSSAIHPSKHKDDNQYILSSLWFFEQQGNSDWRKITQQALLPVTRDYVSFTCEYTDDGDKETEVLDGLMVVQGRKEYALVECPAPSWAVNQLRADGHRRSLEKALERIRKGRTDIRMWIDMGGPKREDEDGSEWLEWRENPQLDISPATTRPSPSNSTLLLLAEHTLTDAHWSPPAYHAKLGICLSPIRMSDLASEFTLQLQDFLEWRIWHRYQGADVVHWSFRDKRFRNWVDRLNTLLGLHDTVLIAPLASNMFPADRQNYGDQTLYAADCLMRHGHADEWQAHIDFDEYLLPRRNPQPHGVLQRLDELAGKVACFSVDHTYWGGSNPVPSVDGFDNYPRNARPLWDTLERVDGYRRQKSIHRTSGVRTIWVHASIELGEGYVRVDDRPVTEVDRRLGNYSNLEVLHARNQLPANLDITQAVGDTAADWTDAWEAMARILAREDLQELYDGRWFEQEE